MILHPIKQSELVNQWRDLNQHRQDTEANAFALARFAEAKMLVAAESEIGGRDARIAEIAVENRKLALTVAQQIAHIAELERYHTDARAEYQAEAARADRINQLRRYDED